MKRLVREQPDILASESAATSAKESRGNCSMGSPGKAKGWRPVGSVPKVACSITLLADSLEPPLVGSQLLTAIFRPVRVTPTHGLPDSSPAALRVLADDLLEHGDVHGEFILLQVERAARGEREAGTREKELAEVMLGRLRKELPGVVHEAKWERGFLSSLHLHFGEEPPLAALRELSRWMPARSLHSLSLMGITGVDLSAFFVETRRIQFPALRKFAVVEIESIGRPRQDEWLTVGNVEPMYAAWSELESLQLSGVGHELGKIVMPKLKTFLAGELQPSAIPSLVAAQWPELEELDLSFDLTPAEAEPVFGALLEAKMSQCLKRVRIHSPWPEFFKAALPRSPLGKGRVVEVE